MTLERSVTFHPAFDKRSDVPSKNFGINGVEIHFLLKGPAGAVGWSLITTWDLPHVEKELDAKTVFWHRKPTTGPVAVHSPVPKWEGHEARECEYIAGGKCFSDASYLAGDDAFRELRERGDKGIWEYLEGWYRREFIKEAP